MKLAIFIIWCAAISLFAAQSPHKANINERYHVSAFIPDGWEQVQGVRDDTVLKLSRSGAAEQKAVMTISFEDIPEGREAAGYDIWNVSNDDLHEAAENSSFLGEPVAVVDVGKGSIDGIHVVWSITRRRIPDSELWEFAYEGIRGSRYLKVRLSSFGDKAWFDSNRVTFEAFVSTLSLTAK